MRVPCSPNLRNSIAAPHHLQSAPTPLFWSRITLIEAMQKTRAINTALGSRAFAPAPRVQLHFQRRNLQDVSITRTGKPILKVQGGR